MAELDRGIIVLEKKDVSEMTDSYIVLAEDFIKEVRQYIEKKINTQKHFELFKTFSFLKNQELDGVKGCYEFKS
jgi:hypothetical protein